MVVLSFLSLLLELPRCVCELERLETPLELLNSIRADKNTLTALQSKARWRERPGKAGTRRAVKANEAAAGHASAVEEK